MTTVAPIDTFNRIDMTVPRGSVASYAVALREAGCLNPTDRARELFNRGRTRFYEPSMDAVVTATIG